MKAYLFVETGEVKPVKPGDYYLDDGGVKRAFMGNKHHTDTILTRHEIEVPEGATYLAIEPLRDGLPIRGTIEHPWHYISIPLPRPKKMVKKTVFLCVTMHDGRPVYSVHTTMPYGEQAYPVVIEVPE